MNKTTEFSFLLKPTPYGIGLFVTHDIFAGTKLELFGNDQNPIRTLRQADVPDTFRKYCIDREDGMTLCPSDFSRMPVMWFINHSHTPNVLQRDFTFTALRDITAGEELTTDYNWFNEPEDLKEDYYFK